MFIQLSLRPSYYLEKRRFLLSQMDPQCGRVESVNSPVMKVENLEHLVVPVSMNIIIGQ